MREPGTVAYELQAVLRALSGDDQPIAAITLSPRAFDAVGRHYAAFVKLTEMPPVKGSKNRMLINGITFRKGVARP